ncbi:MAG: NUDIX hydrolase [Verrucomicrobia bacterium]|nr:NUDIX hydrolase [Verrucomicrobiota bacterium]
MQRRKAPNDGLWSPIGGKLEMGIGESPYEAACRETAEETGVLIQPSDLHMFAMIAEKNYEAKCHWLMFLFACKIPLKNCPPDIDEGHFAFHAPEEVMNLPIPQTDREALWKIYFEHRDGFVALRADCAPGKPLVFHVDERM